MNPIRARSLALSFGYHFICMAHCLAYSAFASRESTRSKYTQIVSEKERENGAHEEGTIYDVFLQHTQHIQS